GIGDVHGDDAEQQDVEDEHQPAERTADHDVTDAGQHGTGQQHEQRGAHQVAASPGQGAHDTTARWSRTDAASVSQRAVTSAADSNGAPRSIRRPTRYLPASASPTCQTSRIPRRESTSSFVDGSAGSSVAGPSDTVASGSVDAARACTGQPSGSGSSCGYL